MRTDFREHMERIDKYLSRLTEKDGEVSLVSPSDETIPLGVIYTLLEDVLSPPTHFGKDEVIERFLYRFCDVSERGVVNKFDFELKGNSLSYHVRYKKGEAYLGEVELPNVASRWYLCMLLSGININTKIYLLRNKDFIYSFDGESLLIKPIENPNSTGA